MTDASGFAEGCDLFCMNEPIHTAGKINVHDAGAGVPSPEQVEQRARELAAIAGRAASDFSESDLLQAKQELLHGGPPAPADEAREVADITTWDDVPGASGRQVENRGPQDEANIAQELVEEGLDEALHDEMLEASKKNIDAAS